MASPTIEDSNLRYYVHGISTGSVDQRFNVASDFQRYLINMQDFKVFVVLLFKILPLITFHFFHLVYWK